jgi:hypothetical protein
MRLLVCAFSNIALRDELFSDNFLHPQNKKELIRWKETFQFWKSTGTKILFAQFVPGQEILIGAKITK